MEPESHISLPHACILCHFSHVQPFETLWTVAIQAPLSMGFSRQKYWRGLPSPPPGDLPDPGIEHESLVSCQEGSLSLVPRHDLPPSLRYCFVLCLVL